MPGKEASGPSADPRSSTMALLRPHAVAVLGASEDPETPGGAFLHSLVRGGFQGPVYPVIEAERGGRRAPSQMMARKVLGSIDELPLGVDLAVVVLPPERAAGAAVDCVGKGARAIVVPGRGFAESHARGRELQVAMADQVGSRGARLLGPNSLGIYSRAGDLDLAPSVPVGGGEPAVAALLSQAGELDALFIETLREHRLGLALYASLGNAADLSFEHLLPAASMEPGVRAVAMVPAGTVDRLALSSAVREVAPRTPVLVAHKVRGRAAMRAARSNAGAAMEASEAMPDLEAAGAVLATDLVDLADRTAAMALQPRARGRRVAVLSTSGGAAVAVASHLEDMGLEVPALPEKVQRALVQWLPEHGTAANPVNLGGALPAGSLRPIADGVLGQPTVDGAVVLAVGADVPALATAAAEAAAARGKPVVGVAVRAPLTAKAMRASGMPAYPSPMRAARAYQALVPGPL